MKTNVRILLARLDHLEEIAPLFDAYRQFYGQRSDVRSARKFLRERLLRGDSAIFVAQMGRGRDSRSVGFMQLYPSFSSETMQRLWILNDLFVDRQGRRKGVAVRLMKEARRFAIRTKAKGIVLETAVDNHVAQHLYRVMGYKRDDVFHRYYLNLQEGPRNLLKVSTKNR